MWSIGEEWPDWYKETLVFDPTHNRFDLAHGEWYKITSQGFLQLGDEDGIFTNNKPLFFDHKTFKVSLEKLANEKTKSNLLQYKRFMNTITFVTPTIELLVA